MVTKVSIECALAVETFIIAGKCCLLQCMQKLVQLDMLIYAVLEDILDALCDMLVQHDLPDDHLSMASNMFSRTAYVSMSRMQ